MSKYSQNPQAKYLISAVHFLFVDHFVVGDEKIHNK